MKTNGTIFKLIAIIISIAGGIMSSIATPSSGLKHVKYQIGSTITCLTAQTQGLIPCSTSPTGSMCVLTATFQNGATQTATAWEHGCKTRLQRGATQPLSRATGIPNGAIILN